MNREYAERICLQIFDALDAMYKAEMAIAGLGKQERTRFHRSVQEVIADLEDKLLLPICEQYPDLRPPTEEQRPRILCSELTWSEVNLPSSVTEDQLDEVIMSLLNPRWRKVLWFVTIAEERYKELGWTISHEVTAARLKVLSDRDRIEGIGDMRYWGNSEVRLKD
ncbi:MULTISPECIES: hypothetical protein [unclassified Bradyrhizobium]|uniref:hypothetical protein n=1 Tax=unclassified Bradyrhizobium TaxID=2631580 RepID=UPI00048B003B|nr:MULTISPECIES: hypothetical protein [unclassified Bradyrhizobium]QIG96374.1 hypothetical protein G6P99_30870 [Bradyrhizobium sp. 6(2017)]